MAVGRRAGFTRVARAAGLFLTGLALAFFAACSNPLMDTVKNEQERKSATPSMVVLRNGAEVANGSTVAFDSIAAGSEYVDFSLENHGKGVLVLSNLPPVTSSDSHFSLDAQPGKSVDPGGSTSFRVLFTPGSIGDYSASIVIVSNDATFGTFRFTVTGSCISTARISLFLDTEGGTPVAAGDRLVGLLQTSPTQQKTRTVAVKNTGTADLHLTASPRVKLTGSASWSVSTQPSYTIPPNTSTTFTLKLLSATAENGIESAIDIQSDDPATPHFSFSVVGDCVLPSMRITTMGGSSINSGSSLDMGSTIVGTTLPLQLKITNPSGPGDLLLTGTPIVAISGGDSTSFTITVQPPVSTLAPAGVTTFTVAFTPAGAPGAKSTTLSVQSNAGAAYTITLTGTGTDWHGTKALDSAGDTGKFPSVACEGDALYVAYYDQTNRDLRYTSSSDRGATWTAPVTVDAGGNGGADDVGQETAIAVSGGDVYVAYRDVTNLDLKFAKRDHTTAIWSTATLDFTGDVGRFPSILASGSSVFISYSDWTNYSVKLQRSTDSGATWLTPVVVYDTAETDVGYWTWLAQSGSNVYMSFYCSNASFMKSPSNGDTGSWSSKVTADNATFCGEYTHLELSGGVLYLVAFREYDYSLRLSKSTDLGANFTTSVIPVGVAVCNSPRPFGFDALGSDLYVAYAANSVQDLYFVHSADGGSTWGTPVLVDSAPAYTVYPCVAATSTAIYAVYYDESNLDLRFAKSINGGAIW